MANSTGGYDDVLVAINGSNVDNTSYTYFTSTVSSTLSPDNDTLSLPSYHKGLEIAKTTTSIVVTLGMMISMGCVITLKETVQHLRRPFGISIGFLCQYGILPLTGFGLAHLFKLEAHYALGVLIMSCCPGGTTSNILTYWIHGDVSLSICMTTCSTIVAFGMMPLLLFLYSRSWTDDKAVIPYTQIVITLVFILVPVVIGMLIRYKSKVIADKVSRVLAIVGLIGIALNLVFEGILRSETYTKHWQLWIIGFMLPAVGAGVSYLVGFIVRLPPRQRRTVAVETGWQNLGVALTLITLSFPNDNGRIGAFVSIYLVIQSSLVLILVPMGCICPAKPDNEKEEEANNDNSPGDGEDDVGMEKFNAANGYTEVPKGGQAPPLAREEENGDGQVNDLQKEDLLSKTVV
ncbi:ileal sodium/bile acid cotransporter-like [Glandiceps talaboti]